MSATSPALQRYFSLLLSPRKLWVPKVATAYAAAEERASKHFHLLTRPVDDPSNSALIARLATMSPQDKAAFVAEQTALRKLGTFIPPTSILSGSDEWSKTVKMIHSVIVMLPTFLLRVRLSRTDPTVERLTTSEWKHMLNGVYFSCVWREEQRARHVQSHKAEIEARIAHRIAAELEEEGEEKEEKERRKERDQIRREEETRGVVFEEYDHTRFWKYGGERFFGKRESDRLKSNPAQRWAHFPVAASQRASSSTTSCSSPASSTSSTFST